MRTLTVDILKIGHGKRTVHVPEGTSIRGALQAGNVDFNGMTVMRGGRTVDFDGQVVDGDVITLSPKVQGGCR